MEPTAFLYNALLHAAACGLLPYFRFQWRRDPEFIKGRMGNCRSVVPEEGSPRIWLQASSVGEVTGAVPLCAALRRRFPEALVFLSAGTPQGYAFARSQVGSSARVLPYPFDLPLIVRRVLDHVKPDLYVSFEGEYWPNLFRLLAGRDVPAVLLNGCLSERSARWYRLFLPLFQPVFKHFTWLAMHSEEDRRRILTLGPSADRTLVLGSSKYSGLLAKVSPDRSLFWRRLLGIPESAPVVMGGSLRGGECTQVLEVYRCLREHEPGVFGVFAPRHMVSIPHMSDWLKRHHIPFGLLTEIESGRDPGKHRVVLVDRIGVLFELYSIGDLVFCGGTLERSIGGHNILEPAAWGKAVFYGPGIEGVLDEHRLLASAGGSFLAEDYLRLSELWMHWVHRLPELRDHGKQANEALQSLSGTVDAQVDLIMDAMGTRGIRGKTEDAKD